MGPFHFPDIDPVIFSIGALSVRWYSMAYIVGLLFGRWYAMRLAQKPPALLRPEHVDGFLIWAMLAVVIGGRLGHVLFYDPLRYLSDPVQILQVWKGGMSFHGGLVGVAVAIWLYARRHRIASLALSDLIAAAAPAGLLLGRIANFINQELWGRPTDVPWAVIFPLAGPEPRHPSQLYEAMLEGALLFVLLAWMIRALHARRRPGLLTGVFLCGYAVARATGELFREPEALTDLLPFFLTYGQLLSLPMLLLGGGLIFRSLRRPAVPA